MARRFQQYPRLSVSGEGPGDQKRSTTYRARITGRGFCARGPNCRSLPARSLHRRWWQYAHLVEVGSVEVRLQLTLQSRSLLRQYQTIYRSEVGHSKPGDDARSRFRNGPTASVWDLVDSGERPQGV